MFKDNNDPVLFDNSALETANMTVLHCREVLEQNGLTREAQQLQGVAVTDPQMAEVALNILQNMRVKADAFYNARDLAISNIRSALRG